MNDKSQQLTRWQRLAVAVKAAYAAYATTDPALAKFFSGAVTSSSGVSVTPDLAMQQTTVFTCTRIIAETLGMLPLEMFEVQPDMTVKPVEHDLLTVLSQSPNDDMDSVEYIEAVGFNLSLQGNSYSYRNARDNKGTISSVYPIPSDDCTPKRKDDGSIVYLVTDRGKTEPVPREKIWHVKGFGNDGLKGLSPIGYQRQVIGTAIATEEWQGKFFGNGVMPSFFFEVPQFLTKDQRVKARESLEGVWAGRDNAYKPQLLEGGIKASPATMPLEDAQFLELKKASRSDIFGFYRIPPHMGGDLERSTNNNIEQQALEFIMYCMFSYFRRIEKSAERWLLPLGQRNRFRIRFNFDALLRADSAARAALYAIMLDHGAMNRNEVRVIEKLPRSLTPGMDDFTVQSAMVPVDMLRPLAVRAATKPAAAPPGEQPGAPAAGKSVTNLIHMPPSQPIALTVKSADINIAPPEVNIDIEPIIKVEAPSVTIKNDTSELASAIRDMHSDTEALRKSFEREVVLVYDNEGNVTGAKRGNAS